MVLPDDSSLPEPQHKAVRREAARLLTLANAFGCYPTPVDQVVQAAKLRVDDEVVLNPGFVRSLVRGLGGKFKRAVDVVKKLLGLYDSRDRAIYLNHDLPAPRKPFVTLHETGHGFMPWQRSAFEICEDNEATLDPQVRDQFEREANVFASEALFQCDRFFHEAEGRSFGLRTPMDLAKKFGASVYASVRRYVSWNPRACAVLVYDQPPQIDGEGRHFVNLRRYELSPQMRTEFGDMPWWQRIYLDQSLGLLLPQGSKRMTSPREISMTDRNGQVQECVCEAFKTPYQVFLLVCTKRTLANSQLSLVSVT